MVYNALYVHIQCYISAYHICYTMRINFNIIKREVILAKRTIRKQTTETISPDGEIIRTQHAIIVDSKALDKNFIKVFKCFTSTVIQDLEIENGKAKLLIWFMDQIQNIAPNQIPVVVCPVEDIAEELKCSEVAVRKWLAFLIKKGYIKRKMRSNGRIQQNTYIINHTYFYRGVVNKMES